MIVPAGMSSTRLLKLELAKCAHAPHPPTCPPHGMCVCKEIVSAKSGHNRSGSYVFQTPGCLRHVCWHHQLQSSCNLCQAGSGVQLYPVSISCSLIADLNRCLPGICCTRQSSAAGRHTQRQEGARNNTQLAADRQGQHEEVGLPCQSKLYPRGIGAGSSTLQLPGSANPGPAALAVHLEAMGIHQQSSPLSLCSPTAKICPALQLLPPQHQQRTAVRSATGSPACIKSALQEGLRSGSMGEATHLTCWRLQPAVPAAATSCPPRRAAPAGRPPTCWTGRTGARRCSHPCRRWRCPHLAGLCRCCRCPGV